jgi:hypothetical protein
MLCGAEDCIYTWKCGIAMTISLGIGSLTSVCCAACTLDPEPISKGGVCACCYTGIASFAATLVNVLDQCSCNGLFPPTVSPQVIRMQSQLEKMQKDFEELRKRGLLK